MYRIDDSITEKNENYDLANFGCHTQLRELQSSLINSSKNSCRVPIETNIERIRVNNGTEEYKSNFLKVILFQS